VQRLEFYGVEDLERIVTRSASILGAPIDPTGARRICAALPWYAAYCQPAVAESSRLRAGQERWQHQRENRGGCAEHAAGGSVGIRHSRPQVFMTIIERFDGGPVGIDSVAAAIGEERGTSRMSSSRFDPTGVRSAAARGRLVTRASYLHFGLKAPERIAANLQLFEDGG